MTKRYIPPTAIEVIPRIVRGWQGLSFSRSSVVRRWADERTDVRVAAKRIGITLTLRQRWVFGFYVERKGVRVDLERAQTSFAVAVGGE